MKTTSAFGAASLAEQDEEYQQHVLPPAARARVSVEAGLALSWYRLIGDAGRTVSLEHYGASADGDRLLTEFSITTSAVVAAAHESLAAVRQTRREVG